MLHVEGLRTHFITRDLDNRLRVAHALNGVSFSVAPGRILGVVGETGAGKSLAVMSILGLLRDPARVVGGHALFEGQDLLAMPQDALNRLRGSRIGLVVQSPKSSLDPLSRVGTQLVRVQRAHRRIPLAEAQARALAALRGMGIAGPERVLRAWPHELSGGMAQRVLLALALVNGPRLLIADEPTTGLDVTVQAQILDLLRDQVRGLGIAALVITHDLGVVAHYCDDMIVMFAGRVVESGPVARVFDNPGHPYARALISAASENGLRAMGAAPPELHAVPDGCCYRAGCALAREICRSPPPWRSTEAGHAALCHFAGERLPEAVA